MFQTIVVGTDGSETAGEAVREAIELAKVCGASIDLVSAYEPVSNQRLREESRQAPEDLQWMVNPREDVEATLREASERVDEAGVTVQTYAREGDPADAILDVAEERHADLMRFGSVAAAASSRPAP
jgi:nucleotide-binding universal stress UspA family protein